MARIKTEVKGRPSPAHRRGRRERRGRAEDAGRLEYPGTSNPPVRSDKQNNSTNGWPAPASKAAYSAHALRLLCALCALRGAPAEPLPCPRGGGIVRARRA